MLTTLFSVTFTSCIDTDVDPIVEAIYANQAELLAAQASVQNAQATLLEAEAEYQLAQAAYELAMAEGELANAAYRLEEVEELRIANAEAQIELDENLAQLEIDLAELLLELNEVGALQAIGHALSYRTYMSAANGLLSDKLDAQLAYAEAEYQINHGLYSDFAKTAFEADVKQAALQVEWQQEYVNKLLAIIEDPTSLPAQITAWNERLDELEILSDLKDAEAENKEAEAYELVDGWDGSDDIREDFISEYEGHVSDTVTWVGQIAAQELIIKNANDALADYAQALIDADADVTTATGDYDAAWLALGEEDAAGNTPAFGAYFTIDADEDAIAAGGAKYAAPANFQEVYVNARIDVLDATAALSTLTSDFAALTTSYNNAAIALAAAQAAFDGNTYAADLNTAEGNLNGVGGAQELFDDADLLYTTTQADFLANKNGTVYTDTSIDAWDLGMVGDHTDDNNLDTFGAGFGVAVGPNTTTTYYRVETWSEPLPGLWVPATVYPMAYVENVTDTELADFKVAFSLANVGATYPNDDVSAAILTVNKDAALLADTNPLVQVYFIEVESDDTHNDPILGNGEGGNLDVFNNATNALGLVVEDAFYTGTTTRVYAADIAGTTAYENLWDAQKAVSEAAWLLSIGDADLIAKQEAFDYQEELFNTGAADIATATTTKTDAISDAADAMKDVDDTWVDLGVELVAGDAGDALKLKTDVAPVTSLSLNEVVFNAEVVLADLEACNEDCLTAAIPAAEHAISLIQPKLTATLGFIADMQAQYDMYIATYIAGGLDADLQAEYNTLMQEVFELRLAKDVIDGEINYLNDLIGGLNASDDLDDLRWDIELFYQNTGAGSFADSMEDLATAEEALATFMAAAENSDIYLEYLQALIDTLDQRYNNALALATEQLRLMNLALGN
jgi:hypothetical protein